MAEVKESQPFQLSYSLRKWAMNEKRDKGESMWPDFVKGKIDFFQGAAVKKFNWDHTDLTSATKEEEKIRPH